MYGRIPLGRKNRLRQIDSLQSLNLPAEYTFPPSEQAESLSSVIHNLKLNSLEDLYKIEMMILYILTLKNFLTNWKKKLKILLQDNSAVNKSYKEADS